MNYNLLEEAWIPVLYRDGMVKRVNILEAFTQSASIRDIAASNPMDRLAILRFLLALLYWCEDKKGNPPEDKDSISCFPSDWFKKLDENRGCFDLLGEKKSFYQDHAAGGKPVAVTNLLHDLPSGTNIAHFRHVRDFRDGLCPACCAMGLLRWPSVASAGTAGPGQSMTASVNGNTPAYSIRMGATLFETLCLNWPISTSVQGDAPVWEGATQGSPLGILKGLTWQSRRVLLAPADAPRKRDFSTGRCCYCDDQTDRLVKKILFRPGWKRPSKDPWADDPHLFRVITKGDRGKEKSIVPSSGGPDDPLEDHATVWHSVLQGLLQRSEGSRAEFHTTLLAASQQLYKDVTTHASTIPSLKQSTVQALLNEKEWLRQLTWRTTSARTLDRQKTPRGHAVIDSLCSTAAKGHAILSGLCAASFLTEKELEKAFAKLTQKLASADENDADAEAKALEEWKREVSEIICRDIERVADLTTPGSPLRRREARDRATKAILMAVSRKLIQKEGAKQ